MQIPMCVLPPDKTASAMWATTVIAAFAVVVGPLVTWFLTHKQLEAARKNFERQIEEARLATSKQLFTPIQQIWISDLRNNISKLLAIAPRLHLKLANEPEAELKNFFRPDI